MMRSDEAEEMRPGLGHAAKGDPAIGHKTVEAENAMGDHATVSAAEAEDFPDTASAKANRKEAAEPEREEAEQHAIGRGREVPTRNVMGHGMRETVSKNTI